MSKFLVAPATVWSIQALLLICLPSMKDYQEAAPDGKSVMTNCIHIRLDSDELISGWLHKNKINPQCKITILSQPLLLL